MKRFSLAILFALIPTLLQAAVMEWGDYEKFAGTIYLYFNTVGSTGVPVTLVSEGIKIYEDGSATEITSGVTLDDDWDSVAGFHQLAINLADAAYEDGKTYTAIMSAGTADGVSVVGQIIGTFSVGRYASATDLAGIDVNVTEIDGDAGAANDLALEYSTGGVSDLLFRDEIFAVTTNPTVIQPSLGINVANQFKGCKIIYRDGALGRNYIGRITACNETTDTITIAWNADATPTTVTAGATDLIWIYPDDNFLISENGIAQSGASTSIRLRLAAPSTTDLFKNSLVTITGGTGVGQTRLISAYSGGTQQATVSEAWAVTPDATSAYAIIPAATPAATTSSGGIVSDSGTAQAGAASSITLRAAASAVNDYYNYSLVTITGGLGAGQTRSISDYVGSTKVATVSEAWATNPDSTSTYSVLPAANELAGATVTLTTAAIDAISADILASTNGAATVGAQLQFLTGNSYAIVSNATYGNAAIENLVDDIETKTNTLPTITAGQSGGLLINGTNTGAVTIGALTTGALTVPSLTMSGNVAITGTVSTGAFTAASLTSTGAFTIAGTSNVAQTGDSYSKTQYLPSVSAGQSGGLLINGTNTGAVTIGALTTGAATIPSLTMSGAMTVTTNNIAWNNTQWDSEVESEVDDSIGGGTGTSLTAIPYNATGWDANLQREADEALKALELDHLLATAYDAGTKPGVSTALLNILFENAGGTPGVPRYTAAALFNAPSGGPGGSETTSDSGTAQAGAPTTITLQAGASTVNNYYSYQIIALTGGTGGGQSAIISSYVGSSRIATINGTWATQPDATTTYKIFPFGSIPGATAPTTAEIWGYPTASITTTSTIGKLLTDNVNATISSRAPETGGNVQNIKQKTDNLPSVSAGTNGGLLIAGSNAATTFASITSTGTFAMNAMTIAGVNNVAQTGDSYSKTQYLPSATAGQAGGVLIAGNNAATTFATLTSTGAFTISGVSDVAQTGDTYALANSSTYGFAALENLVDDIGVAGASLSAIPWNTGETGTGWNVNAQREVDEALRALELDNLFMTAYNANSQPGLNTAYLNVLVQSNGTATPQFTVDALENGPSGTGASASTIADAVWDEAKSGHTTADTFGDYLDAKVSAAGGTATLDPQQVRDAMLLPPTPATPVGAESIDAKLDAIPTTTTLDPQAVRNALCLAPTAPTVAAGSIDALLNDIPATTAFPANFVDLAIAAGTGQVTADAEVVLSEDDLSDITDAVLSASGIAQVHNQAPVAAFTSKLGTRRDGVVVASPTQRVVPGEIAHIWIDCSSLVNGNIANASNEASSNANVVVSAIGVYGKYVSLYVDATAASDGDSATITCNVNPVGTQVIKVSLAIEVDDD